MSPNPDEDVKAYDTNSQTGQAAMGTVSAVDADAPAVYAPDSATGQSVMSQAEDQNEPMVYAPNSATGTQIMDKYTQDAAHAQQVEAGANKIYNEMPMTTGAVENAKPGTVVVDRQTGQKRVVNKEGKLVEGETQWDNGKMSFLPKKQQSVAPKAPEYKMSNFARQLPPVAQNMLVGATITNPADPNETYIKTGDNTFRPAGEQTGLDPENPYISHEIKDNAGVVIGTLETPNKRKFKPNALQQIMQTAEGQDVYKKLESGDWMGAISKTNQTINESNKTTLYNQNSEAAKDIDVIQARKKELEEALALKKANVAGLLGMDEQTPKIKELEKTIADLNKKHGFGDSAYSDWKPWAKYQSLADQAVYSNKSFEQSFDEYAKSKNDRDRLSDLERKHYAAAYELAKLKKPLKDQLNKDLEGLVKQYGADKLFNWAGSGYSNDEIRKITGAPKEMPDSMLRAAFNETIRDLNTTGDYAGTMTSAVQRINQQSAQERADKVSSDWIDEHPLLYTLGIGTTIKPSMIVWNGISTIWKQLSPNAETPANYDILKQGMEGAESRSSELKKDTYKLINEMAPMLPLSIHPAVMATAFGLDGYANMYQRAKTNGMSEGQAITAGLANAANMAMIGQMMGKLGVHSLNGLIAGAAKNTFVPAVRQALANGVQGILDMNALTFVDTFIGQKLAGDKPPTADQILEGIKSSTIMGVAFSAIPGTIGISKGALGSFRAIGEVRKSTTPGTDAAKKAEDNIVKQWTLDKDPAKARQIASQMHIEAVKASRQLYEDMMKEATNNGKDKISRAEQEQIAKTATFMYEQSIRSQAAKGKYELTPEAQKAQAEYEKMVKDLEAKYQIEQKLKQEEAQKPEELAPLELVPEEPKAESTKQADAVIGDAIANAGGTPEVKPEEVQSDSAKALEQELGKPSLPSEPSRQSELDHIGAESAYPSAKEQADAKVQEAQAAAEAPAEIKPNTEAPKSPAEHLAEAMAKDQPKVPTPAEQAVAKVDAEVEKAKTKKTLTDEAVSALGDLADRTGEADDISQEANTNVLEALNGDRSAKENSAETNLLVDVINSNKEMPKGQSIQKLAEDAVNSEINLIGKKARTDKVRAQGKLGKAEQKSAELKEERVPQTPEKQAELREDVQTVIEHGIARGKTNDEIRASLKDRNAATEAGADLSDVSLDARREAEARKQGLLFVGDKVVVPTAQITRYHISTMPKLPQADDASLSREQHRKVDAELTRKANETFEREGIPYRFGEFDKKEQAELDNFLKPDLELEREGKLTPAQTILRHADKYGKRIVWVRNDLVNGYFNPAIHDGVIFISFPSKKLLRGQYGRNFRIAQTLLHELGHTTQWVKDSKGYIRDPKGPFGLKLTQDWKDLHDFIFSKDMKDIVDPLLKRQYGTSELDSRMRVEAASDVLADIQMTAEFWDRLEKANPTLADRVWRAFVKVLESLGLGHLVDKNSVFRGMKLTGAQKEEIYNKAIQIISGRIEAGKPEVKSAISKTTEVEAIRRVSDLLIRLDQMLHESNAAYANRPLLTYDDLNDKANRASFQEHMPELMALANERDSSEALIKAVTEDAKYAKLLGSLKKTLVNLQADRGRQAVNRGRELKDSLVANKSVVGKEIEHNESIQHAANIIGQTLNMEGGIYKNKARRGYGQRAAQDSNKEFSIADIFMVASGDKEVPGLTKSSASGYRKKILEAYRAKLRGELGHTPSQAEIMQHLGMYQLRDPEQMLNEQLGMAGMFQKSEGTLFKELTGHDEKESDIFKEYRAINENALDANTKALYNLADQHSKIDDYFERNEYALSHLATEAEKVPRTRPRYQRMAEIRGSAGRRGQTLQRAVPAASRLVAAAGLHSVKLRNFDGSSAVIHLSPNGVRVNFDSGAQRVDTVDALLKEFPSLKKANIEERTKAALADNGKEGVIQQGAYTIALSDGAYHIRERVTEHYTNIDDALESIGPQYKPDSSDLHRGLASNDITTRTDEFVNLPEDVARAGEVFMHFQDKLEAAFAKHGDWYPWTPEHTHVFEGVYNTKTGEIKDFRLPEGRDWFDKIRGSDQSEISKTWYSANNFSQMHKVDIDRFFEEGKNDPTNTWTQYMRHTPYLPHKMEQASYLVLGSNKERRVTDSLHFPNDKGVLGWVYGSVENVNGRPHYVAWEVQATTNAAKKVGIKLPYNDHEIFTALLLSAQRHADKLKLPLAIVDYQTLSRYEKYKETDPVFAHIKSRYAADGEYGTILKNIQQTRNQGRQSELVEKSIDRPLSGLAARGLFEGKVFVAETPAAGMGMARDESGRIIPPSERFNPQNPNIMFQMRDEPEVGVLANKPVEERLAKLGMRPQIKGESINFQAMVKEANRAVKLDPNAAKNVMKDLDATGRPAIAYEYALLLNEDVRLQKEMAAAAREVIKAGESGDSKRLVEAEARATEIEQEYQHLHDVSARSASPVGQALAFRRVMQNMDYSYEGLLSRAVIAKGNSLTKDELAEVDEMAQKISELTAMLEEQRKALDQVKAEKASQDKYIEELKASQGRKDSIPVYSVPKSSPFKSLSKRGKKAYDFLIANMKPTPGMAQASENAANQIMEALIDCGRDAIRDYPNKAEWDKSMHEAFKGQYDGMLDDVWSQIHKRMAQEKREAVGRAIEKFSNLPADEQPDALRRIAQKVFRGLIDDGLRGREKVLEATFKVISDAMPDVTRRQVMDAISGYGDFKKLDRTEEAIMTRQYKGELRELAKLHDMLAGQPPKKTGMERQEPTDIERKLSKVVEDWKKEFQFDETNPEDRLRTALEAMGRRLDNAISDIEDELAAGERLVREKKALELTPELEKKKATLEMLREQRDRTFGKPEVSDETRIRIAESSLMKTIAELDRRIREKDYAPKKQESKVPADKWLEALRAFRDYKQAELDDLKLAQKPQVSVEERALSASKTRMLNRISEMLNKMALEDFAPKEKKKPLVDQEKIQIQYALDSVKMMFEQRKREWQYQRMSVPQKVAHGFMDFWDATRVIITGGDFPPIFRQGLVGMMSQPIKTAKNLASMLKVYYTPLTKGEKADLKWNNPYQIIRSISKIMVGSGMGHYMEMESIRQRPNYHLYKRYGLDITEINGPMAHQEEAYMSRWAKQIPFVANSERVYTAFLNRMRADMFDMIYGAHENYSESDLRQTAKNINDLTGRGEFSPIKGNKGAQALVGINRILFAPRLLIGRLKTVLGTPLMFGSAKLKWEFAKIYMRMFSGVAAMYALAKLMGAEVEFDPRSSDFGKIKVGQIRLDPVGGMMQIYTFLSRIFTGSVKNSKGQIVPIRGPISDFFSNKTPEELEEGKLPFGSTDEASLLGKFARTKLSPLGGFIVNMMQGQDVTGQIFTWKQALQGMFIPMAYSDLYQAIESEGLSTGAALTLFAFLGMSMQVYNMDTKKEAQKAVSDELFHGNWKAAQEAADKFNKRHPEKKVEFIDMANKAMILKWSELKGEATKNAAQAIIDGDDDKAREIVDKHNDDFDQAKDELDAQGVDLMHKPTTGLSRSPKRYDGHLTMKRVRQRAEEIKLSKGATE